MEVSFTTSDEPSKEDALIVDTGLDEFNHAAAPVADVKPLAAFAHNSEGAIIGGAVGRTWGKCCELLQLWVAEEHRNNGVASQLMREFEQHASTRGCSVFYLTTLSFQAPDFYRKHGYEAIAEIKGYPNEIAKFLMFKKTDEQTILNT